jgi:hypothetical protein
LTALSRLRHRRRTGKEVEEGFRYVSLEGTMEIVDDQATA